MERYKGHNVGCNCSKVPPVHLKRNGATYIGDSLGHKVGMISKCENSHPFPILVPHSRSIRKTTVVGEKCWKTEIKVDKIGFWDGF